MALSCSSLVRPPRGFPQRGWRGVVTAMAAAAVTVAAALIVAAWTLPAPLVLPAVSAAVVLSAATMGAVAWACPPGTGITAFYWDVAGALTAVGVCAALFGEPEQIVALLDRQGAE